MFQPRHITLYVPCYNANATIERCLDSLLNQSIKVKSIFLVDDGSTQNLPDLPVRIITHKENMGLAVARNTALENCDTPLIASVDSDVVAEKDWLEKLLERINQGDVVGVAGRMDEFYKQDIGDRWRAKHMAQHWGEQPLLNPRFLYGANTLMIADELRNSGGFDARCRTNNEDRSMCDSLYERELSLAYEPSAKCFHLRQDTAKTILSSYWGWHHAKGLVEGHYDSLAGVISRIRKVNFGISDYRYNLDKETDEDFAFLDLLIPLVFASKDLKLLSERTNTNQPSIKPLIEYLNLDYELIKELIDESDCVCQTEVFDSYLETFKDCSEEFMIKERLSNYDLETWMKKHLDFAGSEK